METACSLPPAACAGGSSGLQREDWHAGRPFTALNYGRRSARRSPGQLRRTLAGSGQVLSCSQPLQLLHPAQQQTLELAKLCKGNRNKNSTLLVQNSTLFIEYSNLLVESSTLLLPVCASPVLTTGDFFFQSLQRCKPGLFKKTTSKSTQST